MMNESKVEKIMVNGTQVNNRIPAKKLNPFIKAQLLTTLKRDDIVIETKHSPGSDDYYVKDNSNKVLFSFDNGWDYGFYSITLGGTVVAAMDWFENDNYTNADQQSIFDVLKAIQTKAHEQSVIEKAKRTLTPEEIAALAILEVKQK